MAPLETYIKWHRRMWNWLADIAVATGKCKHKRDFIHKYNDKIKQDFPEEFEEECGDYKDAEYMPTCACFCCEYNEQLNSHNSFFDCDNCPLDWDSEACDFPCLDRGDKNNGYYELAEKARSNGDVDNYIYYARIIANLPLKDEVKLNEH